MIVGSNELQIFSMSDLDESLVQKVIFTFSNENKITKEYPGDVTYSSPNFSVPLYQQDTLDLGVGTINREVEIIFTSGSVVKKNLGAFSMEKTLHTELVENDTPASSTVEIEIIDGIVIATAGADIPDTQIANALAAYLDEHPLDTLTEDTVNTLIATYFTEHKDELKGEQGEQGEKGDQGIQGEQGEQGEKGDKGDTGDAYTITSDDYDAIATVVLGKLETAESEEV